MHSSCKAARNQLLLEKKETKECSDLYFTVVKVNSKGIEDRDGILPGLKDKRPFD